MTIEQEVFKKYRCNFNSLLEYGFSYNENQYSYSSAILNGDFEAQISVDSKGNVTGKVIEIALGEEYTNLRLETLNGAFVNEVRDAYRELLQTIRDKCFYKDVFVYPQSNRIAKAIKSIYGDDAEFLWEDDDSGVFRNKKSNKWYGIIMHINKAKLCDEDKDIEAMNIKLNPKEIDELVEIDGFYRAYHMNKKYWITISLDETLDDKVILDLIDKSYKLVD